MEMIENVRKCMVMHGHVEIGTGLIIKGDVYLEPGMLSIGIRTKQRSAFTFMLNEKDKCYGPYQVERIDILLGPVGIHNDGFCVPNIESQDKRLYYIMSTRAAQKRFRLENDYDVIPDMKRLTDDDSFVQEFIYNGRVDNSIKFIYREYTNSLSRASFQQEVQYDLDQSNIIGFKEMRIKIIEATNQKIEYKILKNFTPKRFE